MNRDGSGQKPQPFLRFEWLLPGVPCKCGTGCAPRMYGMVLTAGLN
jgi:hypothetical protein